MCFEIIYLSNMFRSSFRRHHASILATKTPLEPFVYVFFYGFFSNEAEKKV
jgi:hypothetical protein